MPCPLNATSTAHDCGQPLVTDLQASPLDVAACATGPVHGLGHRQHGCRCCSIRTRCSPSGLAKATIRGGRRMVQPPEVGGSGKKVPEMENMSKRPDTEMLARPWTDGWRSVTFGDSAAAPKTEIRTWQRREKSETPEATSEPLESSRTAGYIADFLSLTGSFGLFLEPGGLPPGVRAAMLPPEEVSLPPLPPPRLAPALPPPFLSSLPWWVIVAGFGGSWKFRHIARSLPSVGPYRHPQRRLSPEFCVIATMARITTSREGERGRGGVGQVGGHQIVPYPHFYFVLSPIYFSRHGGAKDG
ncbi:hypothetical protein GW17_00056992 [Ensete ventricosum]|nr:hypothetical protein GW17_00056992 [Ensete ventricosum]